MNGMVYYIITTNPCGEYSYLGSISDQNYTKWHVISMYLNVWACVGIYAYVCMCMYVYVWVGIGM